MLAPSFLTIGLGVSFSLCMVNPKILWAEAFSLAAAPIANSPWHTDLEAASAASVISQRPVLLVFHAHWSEGCKRIESDVFTSAEAMALLTACYEPLRVNVDQQPNLAKKHNVSHLPAAVVLGPDGSSLDRFDCPETPPSFIAAAARSAQRSATSSATRPTSPPAGFDLAAVAAKVQAASLARSADQVPHLSETQLAEIAASQPSPQADVSVASDDFKASVKPKVTTNEPNSSPILSKEPTLWTAETSTRPLVTGPFTSHPENSIATTSNSEQTGVSSSRSSIEPANTANPSSPNASASSPWINRQLSRFSPAGDQPASAATLLETPTTSAPPASTVADAKTDTAVVPKVVETVPSGPAGFMSSLLGATFSPKKQPDAAKSNSENQAPPSLPSLATSPAPPVSTESMPVGMEGYCPVTLIQNGQWVEGRARWGAKHRGRTYLFAGAEQQRMFLSDPDRYSPALSGDDPVLVFDSSKQVSGQRRYGVTYQGRIYLFSSVESRNTFSANPKKYNERVSVAENVSLENPTKRY